jgi:3-oxoacyl-[acyl-carrier protein] reductase
MDLQLKGRSCLVTGASQGIGRSTAKIMAAEGCRVAVVARREELLRQLADEIAETGAERAVIIAADMTGADAAERIHQRVLRAFGRLDILVNNAGGSRPVSLEAGNDVWSEGMMLNFEALRRLTMQFVPMMRNQKWGRILNVTGTSEPRGVNVANSAKAAVHAWAKGLSRVVAGDGITVNSLAPGRLNTEQILERLHADPIERQAFIEANIPMGYFGDPEDMANLIVFLASPRARYITGEVIHVDGGMRMFAY